jgi:hypothetical protein
MAGEGSRRKKGHAHNGDRMCQQDKAAILGSA